MNLSLIADYADVLSTLGIILSLGFVAYQVKQNTRELRYGHWETVIDRLNAFHSRTLDATAADIVNRGQQSYEDLNAAERLAFEGWMHEFILSFAPLRELARQGILPPGRLEVANERVRWMFRNQGVIEWWRSANRVPFAADTAAKIDELMGAR
jgi:hypothetical protein